MPDTKISALTAGNPALATDAIPIARAGANYQVSAASIANLAMRMTSVVASGTLVTLTVNSNPVTLVTGSGGQIVKLPDATTLTLGTTFEFNNNQSSGAITVNNNSNTLIVSVPSGGYAQLTLLTNGTAAGTWDRHDQAPSNVSWSTNTFDYPGSITSATWNGVTVAASRGGTGNSSYVVGDLLYASSTSALSPLPDVATGNALISGGIGAAPSWGKIGLATHVSGTLPTTNGGTGVTSFTSGGAVYATSTSALTTGTLPATAGGTGQASYAVGDLVYASTTTALSTLADVATGNALISGGVGVAPSYGKIGLTTHVSGTLPIANGGTGQTTASAAFNALSPVTTTGDLILGNGTNSRTRLAIGTNGYVLTSNGTTASWQAAGGGGGGVTSFSAGSTGFNPSSATTGAITLSGTLNTGNGGTGTSSTPSNGQLLIGNGSGYSVANLTAGTGVTITNGSGSITIAASGGGGPTINVLNVTTTSSGTFYNNSPSSTYSKPLIGNATGGTNYGAFFFKNGSTGYNVSSASLSSIGITDSTSSFTSYTSGSDFSSSPGTFNVSDDTVACYGLMIYSAGMQTLFADSKTAQTTPNLAPFDATSGYASSNPGIFVSTTTGTYNNSGGRLGAVVSKSMTNYILGFGSADFSSASPTVTSIQITINSSSTTYTAGTDFTAFFANNSSNGGFEMLMSVSNATLQTLLNNSFL